MSLRPNNRGFSRTIFDILEVSGPMSRASIAKELKSRGKNVSSKQLLTCLKNMRHRHWIEFSAPDPRKYDLRSELLKTQRQKQQEMFQSAREAIHKKDYSPNHLVEALREIGGPVESKNRFRFDLVITALVASSITVLALEL